uniref:CRAL-TRIO domain-containing protein n=1 Tax=Pyramimonas obovata TaxID=1411642 RepID=A0A7S0WGT6_9CHLO|eukprot:CAMPEP_0118922906 /NCGR_PEP_ID=MMETSP1169-20130426/1651_1 /TAXON_ID=36882 /ORGANISM="Pyramimonas obovata, Strain CCMP722" /LENGTH=397 /DNA_ID=CAMNT_0006863835 /DNA_START=78 /DNA_END=1271 /DNA_ORIENTATION=+
MPPSKLPKIDDLLKEHADKINGVRKGLEAKGLKLSEEYDDIWILRFVLSHKKEPEATKAAEFALDWRAKNAELIQAVKDGKAPWDFFEHIEKYMCADIHSKRTLDGEPVFMVRAGISNPKEVMNRVTHEQMMFKLLHTRERLFQICDKETRERRELVKALTLNDLNHVSLMGGTDRRFMKALTDASKVAEELYPQLLGRAIIINVPSFFSTLFGLFKSLLSKKTLEKMVVCPGKTLEQDISKCPYVRTKFALEDLPSQLGGKCKCLETTGCVGKIPNDQQTMIGGVGEDGKTRVTVAARDKHTAVYVVNVGDVATWEIEVEDHSVELTVTLKDENDQETTIMDTSKVKQSVDQKTMPTSGVLCFTFDNSFSLLTEKKVKYSVLVMPVSATAAEDRNI